MPVKQGFNSYKVDTFGFHDILIETLYPDVVPTSDQKRTLNSYHTYRTMLLPEQEAAYKKVAADIYTYIERAEPWMLQTDWLRIGLSGEGRSKQMGLICSGPARPDGKRVSFLFNCSGRRLNQIVRLEDLIGIVLACSDDTAENRSLCDYRKEIVDKVLQSGSLPKVERECEIDSLQGDVFDMITKLMGSGGSLGAKALLSLMFGETDLIVIDQKTKVRQTQIEWYPLAMGYGLEDPDTQIEWVSPLVNSRQHTYTSEQFYYQNGAVFNINCNLRGILKPGHIDYVTLSLVQMPSTRWASNFANIHRLVF